MTPEVSSLPLVIFPYQDVHLWIAAQRHGWGEAYEKLAAVVRVSPVDMKKLGLADGGLIELRSGAASIVVEAKQDKAVEEGTGIMRAGPYANYLLSDLGGLTLAGLHCIDVIAAASTDLLTPVSAVIPERDNG